MPIKQVVHGQESIPEPILQREQEIRDPIPSIQVDSLPSNFKPYDMSKGGIFYKPYTYGDLLYFNQSKMDVPTMIEFVLSGIITPFPIEQLTYFDYLFLSILRRMVTFETNIFSIVAICESCGQPISIKKDLSELDFDDLKVSLPVILPTPFGDLHFYPLTVGDYCNLYRKGQLDNDLVLYSTQIKNKTFEESQKILTSLTGEILFDLPKIDEYLSFGVKSLEIKCENERVNDKDEKELCGYTNFVDPFDRESVIVPFRSNRNVNGTRLRFGV